MTKTSQHSAEFLAVNKQVRQDLKNQKGKVFLLAGNDCFIKICDSHVNTARNTVVIEGWAFQPLGENLFIFGDLCVEDGIVEVFAP